MTVPMQKADDVFRRAHLPDKKCATSPVYFADGMMCADENRLRPFWQAPGNVVELSPVRLLVIEYAVRAAGTVLRPERVKDEKIDHPGVDNGDNPSLNDGLRGEVGEHRGER